MTRIDSEKTGSSGRGGLPNGAPMSHYCRLRFVGIVSAILVASSVKAPAAQPAASRVIPATEVVDLFYRWYLRSLAQDRDPVTQDTATLKKYVATTLLDEIDKSSNSPEGLDSDPFLQAQDYLDEWKDHISVAELENNGTIAKTVLTLGAKGNAGYRLKITLKKQAGSWKITRVQRFRS